MPIRQVLGGFAQVRKSAGISRKVGECAINCRRHFRVGNWNYEAVDYAVGATAFLKNFIDASVNAFGAQCVLNYEFDKFKEYVVGKRYLFLRIGN